MKKQYYADLIFIIWFIMFSGVLIYLTIPPKESKYVTQDLKFEVSTIDSANRPIRIAIIDTGLNDQTKYPLCSSGHMSFFGGNTNDDVGHGSQVTEVIQSQAVKSKRQYCFVIIKALAKAKDGRIDDSRFVDAIKYVSTLPDIDIINISAEGPLYMEEEIKFIKSMLDRKVLIVVAAGNRGIELTEKSCKAYPACDDKRIIVVGQKDSNVSNFGPIVDVVVNGRYRLSDGQITNGTSISAAFVTGTVLRVIK